MMLYKVSKRYLYLFVGVVVCTIGFVKGSLPTNRLLWMHGLKKGLTYHTTYDDYGDTLTIEEIAGSANESLSKHINENWGIDASQIFYATLVSGKEGRPPSIVVSALLPSDPIQYFNSPTNICIAMPEEDLIKKLSEKLFVSLTDLIKKYHALKDSFRREKNSGGQQAFVEQIGDILKNVIRIAISIVMLKNQHNSDQGAEVLSSYLKTYKKQLVDFFVDYWDVRQRTGVPIETHQVLEEFNKIEGLPIAQQEVRGLLIGSCMRSCPELQSSMSDALKGHPMVKDSVKYLDLLKEPSTSNDSVKYNNSLKNNDSLKNNENLDRTRKNESYIPTPLMAIGSLLLISLLARGGFHFYKKIKAWNHRLKIRKTIKYLIQCSQLYPVASERFEKLKESALNEYPYEDRIEIRKSLEKLSFKGS